MNILKIEERYMFTREQKLKWWGNGPWVEEPDIVNFEYENYKCQILRMAREEPSINNSEVFGGYLCGYIILPMNHVWANTDISENDIEVHGGITFSNNKNDNEWIIGFDCAHYLDIIPSIENRNKDSGIPEDISEYFKPVYRDVKFVKREIIELVKQAKIAKENRCVKDTKEF